MTDYSRYLNRWSVAVAVAVVIVGGAAFSFFPGGSDTGNQQKTSQNGKKRVKLSNTKYAPYSYRISDQKTTPEERRALAGFEVSRSSSNGVTLVQLNTTRPEYQNQTYRLKDGEQLYFIETSMGDDSGGKEYAMGDDQGVVVDSDGYIVRT